MEVNRKHPRTSMSYNSPISKAFALKEYHFDFWYETMEIRHCYWTRAEKKRIFDAIKKRDIAFVSHFLTYASSVQSGIERMEAVIIAMTYLTQTHFLFQYASFRDSVWRKMNEFEMYAHKILESINCISNWKEYDEQRTMCMYIDDLLHVIGHLRCVLRGTNDQSFNQG